MRSTTATDSETFNDVRAIAEAAAVAAARALLAEMREAGWPTGEKQNPTLWDLGQEGPYGEPALCKFMKEGRGPRSLKVGAHRIVRRKDWNTWLERGGPSAFAQGPDGKFQPKKESSK